MAITPWRRSRLLWKLRTLEPYFRDPHFTNRGYRYITRAIGTRQELLSCYLSERWAEPWLPASKLGRSASQCGRWDLLVESEESLTGVSCRQISTGLWKNLLGKSVLKFYRLSGTTIAFFSCYGSPTPANSIEWGHHSGRNDELSFDMTGLLLLVKLHVLSRTVAHAHTVCKHVCKAFPQSKWVHWIKFEWNLYPRIVIFLLLKNSRMFSCNALELQLFIHRQPTFK